MGKLFPYLLFDGNSREALRFYERALHGKIEALVTVAETPMASQFRAHARNRVIHGRLALGAHTLMASDWMAADPHPGIRGMRVMLTHPQ